MGGYGSGGHNRTHVTAEACVRLDAGMLRRAGAFTTDKPIGWQWHYSSRGIHTCTVQVIAGLRPNAVDVVIVLPNKAQHTQTVYLSSTTCHYGKLRTWLHCPLCHRRAFRLYYYDNTVNRFGEHVHYFCCRQCLQLTYDLRRERGFDRYQSRAMKLRAKLGADTGGMWDDYPDKPKGMHWDTYARYMHKFEAAVNRANAEFAATTMRLMHMLPSDLDNLDD